MKPSKDALPPREVFIDPGRLADVRSRFRGVLGKYVRANQANSQPNDNEGKPIQVDLTST